jgi:hypothetical protein
MHAETTDAAKVENHTSSEHQIIFLFAYFAAILAMGSIAYLLARCRPQVGCTDKQQPVLSPACPSGNWIAAQLGVLDVHSGEKSAFLEYWLENHVMGQLWKAADRRYKWLNLLGDVAFATSTALMLQSVSIGASAHSVSDVCHRISGDGGTLIHNEISSSTTQTSGGMGSGGFDFENTGGPGVVIAGQAVRLLQGMVRGKTHELFVQAEALTTYGVLGLVVHLLGFVMAVVLGVRGATNQADIQDSELDIQRYCNADEAALKQDGAPIEYLIYFQAAAYTLAAGWILGDNVKLAAKYWVGGSCMSKQHVGGGMGQGLMAVTSTGPTNGGAMPTPPPPHDASILPQANAVF